MKQDVEIKDFLLPPNLLSLFRILIGFLVLSALFLPLKLIVVKLAYIIGISTDFLDGFFARRFNWISRLGHILEPIADTLIVYFTMIYVTLRLNFPLFILISGIVIFSLGLLGNLLVLAWKKKWFAEKVIICEISIFFTHLAGLMYFFNLPLKYYFALFALVFAIVALIDYLRQLKKFAQKA